MTGVQTCALPIWRMLSEVLYDSVVVAGNLGEHKWPAGANLKKVVREIQVPTGEMVAATPESNSPRMMVGAKPPMRTDGYDLESSLSLDFNALLRKEEMSELEKMRRKSNEQIEARKMTAAAAEQKRMVMKYRTEKGEIGRASCGERVEIAVVAVP